jgi:GntR family transcriptional regulator
MNIKISAVSQIPIYEQIENQIREEILCGKLLPDTQLPSIRALARELKVGVITSKRAYDDLCEEGMLISRAGIGVFVAQIDREMVQNTHIKMLKEQLTDLKDYAESIGVEKEELINLLKSID